MLPLLLLTLHLLPLLKLLLLHLLHLLLLHLLHLPLPMLLLLPERLLHLLLMPLHLLPMPLHLLPANNFVKHHPQKGALRRSFLFWPLSVWCGSEWLKSAYPSRCGDRPSENLFQTACLFPL